MVKEYEYEIRVTATFVKDSVQRHVSRVPTATMLESQIGNFEAVASVFVRSLHHRHILTPSFSWSIFFPLPRGLPACSPELGICYL